MTIVSPTLEQLAQYGSLDSLPFSLDNAQYVDFRDPNLDQLAKILSNRINYLNLKL